jgi:exonuclease SbcD
MRIFHLSDLHIGMRLCGRDLSKDQAYVLGQVVDLVAKEKPDVVVLAGDLYDKAVPSAEAVAMFDGFLTDLLDASKETTIMAIAGNHDSAPRIDYLREILKRQNVYIVGNPPMQEGERMVCVTKEDAYGPVNFYLLPFVKPSMVRRNLGLSEGDETLSYDESVRRLIGREDIDQGERNVLVSHQFYLPVGKDPGKVERSDNETVMVGNIDQVFSDVLDPFDYAALGHIHKPMKVGSEVLRYCGTPMGYSISEANQQKGIIDVTLGEKGEVKTEVLPLYPLHAIRDLKGESEELLAQGCDDYVRLTLTDQSEHNSMELLERLRDAFPGLLEIRREHMGGVDYSASVEDPIESDPFTLICDFLKDSSDEEKEILEEVINSVKGGSV